MEQSTENKRKNTCKVKKTTTKSQEFYRNEYEEEKCYESNSMGLKHMKSLFQLHFCLFSYCLQFIFSSRKRSFILPMSVTPFEMGNTDWNIQNLTSVITLNTCIFDLF